jgi:DNA-binding MarR family transcriptional regulator
MTREATLELPPASVADNGVLALEDFTPYRLSVLANTVSRALAKVYQRRFGLSVPQWRVMAVLGRFPGLSANEVADKTAMDKVMVSRAVAGLIADGRVVRRVDIADRRRATLRLTSPGTAIYRQIVPVARDYERRLLAALDPADRQALQRLTDQLTGRARDLAAEEGS